MIKFISEHSGMLFAKTFEHLYISIVALVIAMIVAVPLGILLSKKKAFESVIDDSWRFTNDTYISGISFNDSIIWRRKNPSIALFYMYYYQF